MLRSWGGFWKNLGAVDFSIFLFFIILSAGFLFLMLTDAKPGAQTRRRGQIVPDGTISVSSKRLVADYQADPARADLRYKHRTLKVTGKIVVTGSASVSLEGESAYGYNQLVVNVALKPGEVSKIAALVHGQSAAFTGVCTGMGDSGSIGIEAAEFANQTAR